MVTNKVCPIYFGPNQPKSSVCASDPNIRLFFQLAKDYCFRIHKTRISILKQKSDKVKVD